MDLTPTALSQSSTHSTTQLLTKSPKHPPLQPLTVLKDQLSSSPMRQLEITESSPLTTRPSLLFTHALICTLANPITFGFSPASSSQLTQLFTQLFKH